jgi:hypothetical protein
MLRSNPGKGGSLIPGDHTWTNHREPGDDSDHVTTWTRQVSRVPWTRQVSRVPWTRQASRVHRKTYEQW